MKYVNPLESNGSIPVQNSLKGHYMNGNDDVG